MKKLDQRTFSQTKLSPSTQHLWKIAGNEGATDPKVIMIRWLKQEFETDIVWADRIHIPDSYVTSTDFLFAVVERDDDTISHGCHAVFNNMLLDVIIYQRQDCYVAGHLELIDKFIASKVKELVGDYGLVKIHDAKRTTSRRLNFIEDNFRARAVSVSIDYGFCK